MLSVSKHKEVFVMSNRVKNYLFVISLKPHNAEMGNGVQHMQNLGYKPLVLNLRQVL